MISKYFHCKARITVLGWNAKSRIEKRYTNKSQETKKYNRHSFRACRPVTRIVELFCNCASCERIYRVEHTRSQRWCRGKRLKTYGLLNKNHRAQGPCTQRDVGNVSSVSQCWIRFIPQINHNIGWREKMHLTRAHMIYPARWMLLQETHVNTGISCNPYMQIIEFT